MERPDERAAVRETHVSYVVLLGDRAYKLKKPVRTGFLDFRTEEARARACAREVALNRRLAPDVYLGVRSVVDELGHPLDHIVAMRRMRDAERLSRLIADGVDVGEGLDALAHQLAAFHAGAATSPRIAAAASPAAVRSHWEDDLVEMERFVGVVLPGAEFARVALLARRYLDGRAPLLARRAAGGLIRDGHGDLLADDIFLTSRGPRVLDCLEFDDDLRYGDVLADVAFLAMDLERLGRADLGRRFLDRYRDLAGWGWPASLEHHYVAYRAHVRSKVACLRHEQGQPGAAEEARALHRLCLDHLERGRVRLVLIGGAPGTGKSTVAAGLSARSGWALLRSDEIRKDLAGVGHLTSLRSDLDRGRYAPGMREETYAELLRRARAALGQGETVVADASWAGRAQRSAARLVAAETCADLIELRCEAPGEVAGGRLRTRGGDASDADPELAAALRARFEPWPEALCLDTAGPVDQTVAGAARLLQAPPD